MLRSKIALYFMVACSFTFALGVMYGRLMNRNEHTILRPYSSFEQLAIREYGRRNMKTDEEVLGFRTPLAIDLGNRICVGLAYKRGGMGSSETFCFDRETRQLESHFTSGE